MLNISKDSWHYKVATFMGDTPPKSLCSYFWSLVGTVVLMSFLAVVCGWAGVVILMTVLDPLLTLAIVVYTGVVPDLTFVQDVMGGYRDNEPITWVSFFASYIAYVTAAMLGRSFWLSNTDAGEAYKNRKKDRKKDREETPLTARSVLYQGVMAIKNRVCPRIKYVEK